MRKKIWDKSKIKKILNNHNEMTIDAIKQVPNILEDSITVIQSKTRLNSITLFGEVFTNDMPILTALQLNPKSQKGKVLNLSKIASAYARRNAQVRYTENQHGGSIIKSLLLSKCYSDGTIRSYVMTSDRKGTLTAKTSCMEKEDYMKKKPSLLQDVQSTPSNTSKTKSSLASTNNIDNGSEKSNKKKYSLKDHPDEPAMIG
ncbi:hypothetical protein NE619_08105 [Anaerovorax odorimutans]|uniref:Phage MuF C-terminal domain-containing protein n=1 Tax=Anaerovorax odorimutans TaxID=109327 RepID=A0ABT1RNE8_9FIRM|nr:hypothetical protein [Anaerovorax odorimutans]MCQ4636690.1 hypothetical protein [Anaerovorax odorimutans]